MNIEQPAVIVRYETCGEDAHETGEQDKIRMKSIDLSGKRSIEAVAIRIVAMLDDSGVYAVCLGDIQPFGIRAIADHCRDTAGQLRFQQGLHVAAATRKQEDDFFSFFVGGGVS